MTAELARMTALVRAVIRLLTKIRDETGYRLVRAETFLEQPWTEVNRGDSPHPDLDLSLEDCAPQHSCGLHGCHGCGLGGLRSFGKGRACL